MYTTSILAKACISLSLERCFTIPLLFIKLALLVFQFAIETSNILMFIIIPPGETKRSSEQQKSQHPPEFSPEKVRQCHAPKTVAKKVKLQSHFLRLVRKHTHLSIDIERRMVGLSCRNRGCIHLVL